METIKMYVCECGEDVYEGEANCVACNRVTDPSKLADLPVDKIKKQPRNDRRVRRVEVQPYGLAQMLRSGGKIVQNALPPDATPVGGTFDAFNNTFVLFVRSREFAFVPEGESAPTHPPIGFQTIAE